jgi:hypothetical protein
MDRPRPAVISICSVCSGTPVGGWILATSVYRLNVNHAWSRRAAKRVLSGAFASGRTKPKPPEVPAKGPGALSRWPTHPSLACYVSLLCQDRVDGGDSAQ